MTAAIRRQGAIALALASLALANLVLANLVLASPAQAQKSTEDFYKGTDIRLLIGAGVGGTYGLYGQLAARHLRKHIPGQPNIVLQTMPGAGGNIALNYTYAVAPKDGSVMHLIHSDLLFETLLNPAVKYNAKDFNYIGRISDADSIMLTTRASKVASLDVAKAQEVTMGATGRTNIFALTSLMMNRVAGTRFKIIAGYKSASDIMIAMERGELDSSGMSLANALTIHGDKLKKGDLVPLFAIAAERLPEYPKIPVMTEFGNAAEKTLMQVYVSSGFIGRGLAFPPGVPADRVAAIREAFQKMVKDPEFLAETRKTNIPVAPLSGEGVAAYVTKIMATPADQIAAARKLHKELLEGK